MSSQPYSLPAEGTTSGNKTTTAAWKIWLALILAVLIGGSIGIIALVATKALVLLVGALAWLAPFFLMAFLGAVLLTQIVAVLLLFRANLDKNTQRMLLWIGVYCLPLSGASLTLLLAYTAFGATAAMPLFWAGLVGFIMGFLGAEFIYYKLYGHQPATPSQKAPKVVTTLRPIPTPPKQFQTPILPLPPAPPLSVWDHAETKHFNAKLFFAGLANKLKQHFPNYEDIQGISFPKYAYNFFSDKSNASNIHSKEEALLKIFSHGGSTLTYFAIMLHKDNIDENFFAGVSDKALREIQQKIQECSQSRPTSYSASGYDNQRPLITQEEAGLAYLREILRKAIQAQAVHTATAPVLI